MSLTTTHSNSSVMNTLSNDFFHYSVTHQASYLSSHASQNIVTSSFPKQNPANLSAGIATSGAELVLVVDLVGAVAGDARRRNVGLLHAVDGGAGRVVFAADLGVAGIGRVVVEGGDFGDVLAVGLALVLDGLLR